MYCPKCMIEIQYNSETACPNCATPLVEKPQASENAFIGQTSNQGHAAFEPDDIMRNATPHADFASPSQASRDASDMHSLFTQDTPYQNETEQSFELNAVFQQMLDAETDPSYAVSNEQERDGNGSTYSTSSDQNTSRKLLDTAFEEIDNDDETASTPGGKSLAIFAVLGALILVGVIGAGIYYLKHIPGHEALMQKPERILTFPSANTPAPTLKSSRTAEQQGETAQAPGEQYSPQALHKAQEQQTPAAGIQQNNQSAPGLVAAAQETAQALPAQVDSKPAQKKEALPGGNDTTQSSTAAFTSNSLTDSGAGSHVLLCGSFQDKNKALNLAKKIKAQGYPAFVEKADIESKGVWYRIKIAGFSSKNAAEKARDELKRKLKLEAVVTKRK